MTRASTLSSTSTRAMMEAAHSLGVDTAAVLAQCGVHREALSHWDTRLLAAQVPVIWRALIQAAREPTLHLLAAQQLPFGAYPVIDYMAGSSSNVGHGMTRLSRYFALINSGATLPVVQEDGLQGLALSAPPGHQPHSGLYAEYTFAITLLRFRQLCGRTLTPQAVRIASPRPAYAPRCDALFGCALSYNAPHHQMLFSNSGWNAPHLNADSGVCEVLETHAKRLLYALPTARPFLDEVSRAIASALPDGQPRVQSIAKGLGVSQRTLQRRLRDADVTFRGLLDDVRKEQAMAHLANPAMDLCEIAFLIGFGDQSAFQRAFRRWTGVTPGLWRAQKLRPTSKVA